MLVHQNLGLSKSILNFPKMEQRKRNFGMIVMPSVRLLTIVKSGTHLLEKALTLMGYPKEYFGPPHHVYYGALHPINWENKNILQVRDCRDTLVSLVNHVDKIVNSYLNTGLSGASGFVEDRTKWLEWKQKSFDEKLMDAITHNNKTGYDFVWATQKQWETAASLKEMVKAKPAHIILTYFENLVGEKGGGTDEAQRNEILKISQFLGMSLTENQIAHIQANLWGATPTFNKGQIGRWKEHFKPEHVKAFLPRYQKYLELFGYEKDASWAKPYFDQPG